MDLHKQQYIDQLTPIEQKAYQIAQSLGSSFNLIKSNGFIEWKKTQCSTSNSTGTIANKKNVSIK